MDKALERDASIRYQNATDFGRELVRTIDRMPETQAAERGTELISIPPTRVGPGSPQDVPGATATVGAQISGAPVTQAAAPEKKKSKVPMYAGAAVIVVAAAVAIPILMRDKSGAAKTDATNGTVVIGRDTTTAKRPDTSTPANPTKGSPVDPYGKRTPNVPTGNIEQILTKLEADVQDSTKADDVLLSAKNLHTRLTNRDDQARSDYVRYRASVWKGDGAAACSYLKEAIDLTTDAAKRERWRGFVSILQDCS